MVDGVAVQHDDLHGPRQFEDPLDLSLDLGQAARPRVGLLEERPLGRVVEDRLLAEGDVRADPGDDDPSLKLVLEELEHSLLHHVGHLVALEARPDDDDRPHAGHHVVGRDGLDLAQQALLLLLALDQGAPSPRGLRTLHRLWRRSHLLTILVDRHLGRALLLVHEPAHLGAGVLCLVGVHLGGLVLSELDPQVLELGGGGDEADLTALLHPATDPPVGIVPLHHVEVVAHPEADGRPMDRGVVVKGAIEGDVGLDGEDHRLGASFLELE